MRNTLVLREAGYLIFSDFKNTDPGICDNSFHCGILYKSSHTNKFMKFPSAPPDKKTSNMKGLLFVFTYIWFLIHSPKIFY